MDHGQQAAERSQAAVARRLKRIYKDAIKEIDTQLKDYTAKFLKADAEMRQKVKAGTVTSAQYQAWQRGQAFTGNLWRTKREMLANTLYDADVLAQRIINGERLNVFAENANSIAYDMEHGEGVDMGFGYFDSATVARLVSENPDLLPVSRVHKRKDTAWHRGRINNAITKGIITGKSIKDIAADIARQTASGALKTALRNARTAMTSAQNAGRIEAMHEAQRMGIKVQKRWLATLDKRTRDSHRDLDGQIRDVDKPFNSDLGAIMFPGDTHAAPCDVYNCRCTLTYVHPEYPSNLSRRDQTTGEVIADMNYRQWAAAKKAQEKVGLHINYPDAETFKRDFDKAKATLPKGGEWRVDDTHTVDDYRSDRLFELDGGSVVAVAPDGNIISVCKNQNGADRGSDLLKVAIANGGDRLDAFGGGLYRFYTKNGFEPVSWTPFNEEYAPHDWVKGRDAPEPVIFYRYTGKTTPVSYENFLTNTPASAEYDDAMSIRDKKIDSSR